jgi:hypothetical protein
MKRTLGFLGVLLAAVITLYIWNEAEGLKIPVEPRILAKQSVLIVYATIKRDVPEMPLIIKEVWKDERKTNSPLIGLKLARSTESNMLSNQIPDGAIVFFKSLNNHDPRTYVFVRKGSVTVTTETDEKFVEMTLEQYKRSCELPP